MREKTRNNIRFTVLSGLFIALGIVLPIAFHVFPDGGKVFLPMFLPVLLGAMFLPWHFALAVGVITPLLSSLLTGMPPMLVPLPMAIIMAVELGIGSALIALLKETKWIKGKGYRTAFILIPALLAAFIAGGVVIWGAVQFFGVKGPGMWTFIAGSIVTGLPGIGVQLVVIPLLYTLLKKRQA